MTVILRDVTILDGYAWGWGAEAVGGAPPERRCDSCHHRKRRPEHRYRGGRVWLCSPCARRAMVRAFPRPLDAEEIAVIRRGQACVAIPVPDHLAALYA